jgi:hypothetical protein
MAIFNSYVCLPKGTFKRLEPQPEIPAHAWCMQMLTPKILEVDGNWGWYAMKAQVVISGLPWSAPNNSASIQAWIQTFRGEVAIVSGESSPIHCERLTYPSFDGEFPVSIG